MSDPLTYAQHHIFPLSQKSQTKNAKILDPFSDLQLQHAIAIKVLYWHLWFLEETLTSMQSFHSIKCSF